MSIMRDIIQAPWLRILRPKYRPNVAVIVTNEEGDILLAERLDLPGVIQTVQGGIDAGEDVIDAGVRETAEELGIDESVIEPIEYLLDSWSYDWPNPWKWPLLISGYKGQEQQFVLVRIPKQTTFRLGKHFREFKKVWWERPENVLNQVNEIKKEGIEKAMRGFNLI